MTTENYFYLDSNNQPIGPLDLSALSELANVGVINPESLVAKVGGSEWVAWKSVEDTVVAVPVVPANKEADAATQKAKPMLLPEAYAIYKKAKVETSEFDKGALVSFPTCSAGVGLFSNYSAFFRSSYIKGNDGQLLKFVGTHGLYLTISQESLVDWSKADLSGGSSLEINEITTDFTGAKRTSHLLVLLEKDVLTKHMNTGMKIRVSSPSQGQQQIIEIKPADIQAVLFFQNEDAFAFDPAAAKAAADKENTGVMITLWAIGSWLFGILVPFAIKDHEWRIAFILLVLAAPYFVFKYRRKKKEQAALADNSAQAAETPPA